MTLLDRLDNNTTLLIVLAIVVVIVLFVALIRRSKRKPASAPRPGSRKTPVVPGASLYILAGPGQGGRIQLGAGPLRVGRLRDNDVHIDAPLVSRQHAILSYQNGAWRIVDQDSTNGTWVNGQRITERVLQANDRIGIGPSIFVFQPAGSERTPSPQPYLPPVERPRPTASSVARIHDLNNYELTEVGRGGEGVVYRGVARADRSVVAIKILESQDPYLERKFKQVGAMGVKLRHPHIVAIYHFGQQGESYYLIMEYVDGGSLRDRMQVNTPAPPDEAIRILGQTCEALDYAHAQQVIHRDIKPSNILFDRGDQVKLSDFGIARILSQPTITQMGLILGTPEYMSYEQARGQPATAQSDIYSLGIVAYQLFTGQLPFVSSGPDSWRLLDMHLKERPRPPRQINPSLNPGIEAAILRSLEKDANKRFRTGAEFARALGYNGQTPVVPNSPGVPQMALPKTAPPMMNARLMTETGQMIPITETNFHITRTLLGNHVSVSRQHARIVFHENQYWLHDEQSTNGTWRNGQRVQAEWMPLQSGDVLVFGQIRLRFMVGL